MNELSLFSGAGGGILGGILLGWRTVCAVEAEPYRREVLLRRQRDGMLPLFPIWDDARTFDGKPWRRVVDVISAGFPCQPFSVAGKRKGKEDERNMWPDTIRIIREVKPSFCFLENVPGLLNSGYYPEILGSLAEAGYDAEWCVLGADDVGAPHRRKRLWILALPNAVWLERESGTRRWGIRQSDSELADSKTVSRDKRITRNISEKKSSGKSKYPETLGSSDMANSDKTGCGELCRAESMGSEQLASQCGRLSWWIIDPAELPNTTDSKTRIIESSGEVGTTQSFLGRVVNGLANRVDRLAAIGDGQVSLVAASAWTYLINEMKRR